MRTSCERCHATVRGRSDKRFCSAACRSRAWYDAHFVRTPRVVKHGAARVGSKTSEYRIWCVMRERCYSPSNREFKRYGGRGIHVCFRWEQFRHFITDMGPRPSAAHSIDRINPNKGYSPQNCRWATRIEQARNKRNSIMLTFRGRTRHVLDWAEEFGLARSTIRKRLQQTRDAALVLRPSRRVGGR